MDVLGLGAGIAGLLSYYNTLDAGFVYDDRRAILNNQDVLPTTPLTSLWANDFWGTPITSSGSHGSYRPLCVLTFRLNYILGGGFRPYGFHLVNVLLHTLCTFLVVKLARIFFQNKFPVFVCGFLFSLHPIHTEAVAGIVGRADIAACIFYIISFLSYVKHVRFRVMLTSARSCYRFPNVNNKYLVYLSGSEEKSSAYLWFQCTAWLILCLLASACAMLSKESGLTVLLVCGIYDVVTNCRNFKHFFTKKKHRGQLASMCTLGFVLFGLLLIRVLLMGAKPPVFASSDNPSSRCPSSLTRTLTFLYLPPFNFFLLLFPRWLSYDWSMDAIPRINSVSDCRNVLTFAFYYLVYKILKLHAEKVTRQRTSSRVEDMPKCQVCKTYLNHHGSNKSTINNNNNNNNYYKFNNKDLVYLCKSVYPRSRCDCTKCLKMESIQLKYKNYIMTTTGASAFSYSSERSGSHVVLLSLAFLVVPFLPATNLFFYVGFVIAERVLYIPSVGYCLLVSYGCDLLYKKTNKKAVILCASLILLTVCAVRTIIRNNDWNNEESLYRSGIPVNPPKSYGNLGSILNAQGRADEAEAAYRLALKHRPNMAEVYYNLGVLQQGRMQYKEAIQSYQLAIQYRPSLALAHLNLGQLLASQGRCEEAVTVLRRCSQLDGAGLKDQKQHETTKITALLHLGRLFADQGRYHKAISVYTEAVNAMPHFYQPQVLYNLLGDAYSQLKQTEEAEKWYKAALQAKPDHVPAHLTYGKLLAKNRTRISEAEQWFLKAKKLAPSEPAVYQHFGQFLSELERHSEAAVHYVRAAELAPGEYEAVVNAATALRQADRKSEAEKYYRQAVQLRPEDARSHSNLGAMLHLNGKYKEAVQSYKLALKLQPGDVTTLANLHKLKSLMKKLET